MVGEKDTHTEIMAINEGTPVMVHPDLDALERFFKGRVLTWIKYWVFQKFLT
jgi:hypothetical protein